LVLEIENQVEVQRGASTIWDKAYTTQPLFAGDSIKTSDKSRAILQLYDLTRSRVDQNTLLKITSPPNSGEKPILTMARGLFYLFSRNKPVEAIIRTPTTSAAI